MACEFSLTSAIPDNWPVSVVPLMVNICWFWAISMTDRVSGIFGYATVKSAPRYSKTGILDAKQFSEIISTKPITTKKYAIFFMTLILVKFFHFRFMTFHRWDCLFEFRKNGLLTSFLLNSCSFYNLLTSSGFPSWNARIRIYNPNDLWQFSYQNVFIGLNTLFLLFSNDLEHLLWTGGKLIWFFQGVIMSFMREKKRQKIIRFIR